MVFQFGALFDSMTVGENIGLALQKLTNCDRFEIDERISNSLLEVNMENTQDKMPSELSGGMKKRVGIARAIALKIDNTGQKQHWKLGTFRLDIQADGRR